MYDSKQIYEFLNGRVSLDFLHQSNLGAITPSLYYLYIKMVVDMVAIIVALPLLLPLMLATAALIKIDSPGPIFFLQKRVGQGNKDFIIYKFRSMHVNAELGGAKFAEERDCRTTRVGALIRRYRIDELPQFFNVLKGDMSLIGPRPEQRVFVEKFQHELPFYMYRHMVRPGISGWAQVMYGYSADIDSTRKKVEYDLYYIKNFSVWLDVLIVFKTIKTMATGFGAR
ncbi:TPA: exopolysaccharide biosynthesis polyprenyl glycosylphosphotransferase [Aeromonas salmonicida]